MNIDEYSYLDQQAVDELAAAVLRTAYDDLLRAYLFDAAVRFHECSYNCHLMYEKLKGYGRTYSYDTVEFRPTGWTVEAREEDIRRKINDLTDWFTKSERCRMLLRSAKGVWFVEQAKKHAEEFALDLDMAENLKVIATGHNTEMLRIKAKRTKRWRKERDAWRKAHNLSEVKDGDWKG